jgi:hypothetical protein
MLMQIKAGQIKKGDTIVSCAFGQRYDVFEVKFSVYIYFRGWYPKPRVHNTKRFENWVGWIFNDKYEKGK